MAQESEKDIGKKLEFAGISLNTNCMGIPLVFICAQVMLFLIFLFWVNLDIKMG